MKTDTKVYQQKSNELDIPAIMRALVRNWWLILLCGCILAMWLYMGVSITKRPIYISEATLVITNNGNEDLTYTDAAIEKVAGQYQKILNSTTLKNTMQKALEVDELPGSINATTVSGTNLIMLRSTASTPGQAYTLVKTAINNYSKVSSYVISTFVLDVMKEPVIPMTPANKNLELIWAIRGFFAGILGSAFMITLFCFMREDIKNENQVSKLLDSTLFASIYYEKKTRREKKTSILITNPITSFFYSENIRKMATKLDYRAQKNHHKVIVITSVQENEGKSTIAANLALALAAKNRKVLLLDADLRKPALYKVFDKNITKEIELSSYLKGDSSLQEVLTKDKDTGLYYVFGTKSFRNSDGYLSSKKMKNFITATRAAMDYIIIDTPPAGLFPDVELIAEYADAGVLVVRQETARVADINDTLDTLKKSNIEIYGCVLNAIQTKIMPKSAEYGYSYGYGGYKDKYGNYKRYGKYGRYGAYAKKTASSEITSFGQKKKISDDKTK